jgi:hypothetical protein
LIAGVTLGGLTLAHGLRHFGLGSVVRTRLGRPDLRSYRIHIDATGSRALHRCLRMTSGDGSVTVGRAAARNRLRHEHLDQLAFVPGGAA